MVPENTAETETIRKGVDEMNVAIDAHLLLSLDAPVAPAALVEEDWLLHLLMIGICAGCAITETTGVSAVAAEVGTEQEMQQFQGTEKGTEEETGREVKTETEGEVGSVLPVGQAETAIGTNVREG